MARRPRPLGPLALLLALTLALPAVLAQEADEAPGDPRAMHADLQAAVLARVAELAWRVEPLGIGFVRPAGGPVSSYFGWRNISVAGNRYHGGVDFAADMGSAVIAARGGVVSFSGWAGAYGYAVYLEHEAGWQTRYAHLSRIDVRTGDRLAQGAVLGAVGSTGASTGPHLHFEVRFEGRALDPLGFVQR